MSARIAKSLDQFLDEQVERRQMEGMPVRAARLRVGQMVALALKLGLVKQEDVSLEWLIETQEGRTARFIVEARAMHGDKYGYEKAVYDDSRTYLIVTCPYHGDWQVTPTSHIHQGNGCPRCAEVAMIKYGTPTFIAQARAVHGDKYTYEKAEYKGSHTFLTVTCPKHGDWQIMPVSHIHRSTGCPGCSGYRPPTVFNTTSFIAKAREIHGDRYTYDKAVYENSHTYLTVTCPRHGDWRVTPTNHLHQRRGCLKCAINSPHATYDTPTFIARAREVHKGKYTYDRAEYKGGLAKLTVTCPKHGDWQVTPFNHLTKGSRCPRCPSRAYTPANIRAFIDKARAVHGDKYSYVRTAYVSTST